MMTKNSSKKTCLYNNHIDLKGKMVPFAGYEMPVWYSTITEEHLAIRQRVGMFDISHMGLLLLEGPDVADLLQRLSCNDLKKTKEQKMVYSMMLNEKGMVLDDVMIGGIDESFLVVVNAANKAKIREWIKAHQMTTLVTEDLNKTHSFLAVQGPEAIDRLTRCFSFSFQGIPRFGIVKESLDGVGCYLLRTGYTGEDGFELIIPNDAIASIWKTLLDAGITPCGLGARDTLRLEKGLPLYGQELSESIHPLMTRYQWVVKWDHDFIGKEALLELKEREEHCTVGLEMQEKAIPRPHYKVKEGGEVTSGTLLPGIQKAIAMAIIPKKYATIGTIVYIMIRNKACAAKVVPVPFK